jgi:hypothetical protein
MLPAPTTAPAIFEEVHAGRRGQRRRPLDTHGPRPPVSSRAGNVGKTFWIWNKVAYGHRISEEVACCRRAMYKFMASIDRPSNVLAAGRLQRHGPSLRYLPRPLGQMSSFSPALTSPRTDLQPSASPVSNLDLTLYLTVVHPARGREQTDLLLESHKFPPYLCRLGAPIRRRNQCRKSRPLLSPSFR